MSLAIFGVGILVFFLTVYGVVIAGGLQLAVREVAEQPEPAAPLGSGENNTQVKDIT